MKILDDDSPLKYLPALSTKEILIFDAIRICVEIIDNSYAKLVSDLQVITVEESKPPVSITFGYAWSIIDNSAKLYNICKQLPWEKENEIIGHLYYLIDFRNTYQHIHERIDVAFLVTQSPFFGVISWFNKISESKPFEFYQLVSGILVHGPNAKQTVPDFKDCEVGLNAIMLHTVIKKGKNQDAELTQTNLSVVINDIKKLVTELERRLNTFVIEQNLTFLNWDARKDVILHFKQETE